MAGTTGHSGGARPGAGRKPNPRLQQLNNSQQQAADHLQQTLQQRLATLELLARGGAQTITERWEPAGTLFIDSTHDVLDSQGNPTGKTTPCKRPAFPNLPADQLVLVSRIVRTLPPNLAANIYLTNRQIGVPFRSYAPIDHDNVVDRTVEFVREFNPNGTPLTLEQILRRPYSSDASRYSQQTDNRSDDTSDPAPDSPSWNQETPAGKEAI
jgi:hypothetical protein